MLINAEKVNDDFAVLKLENVEKLNINNSSALRELMFPYLKLYKYVALDMSDVRFVDSSGLGVLIFAMKQLQSNSGNLFLYNLNESVKILFELTRLNKVFLIYPTRVEVMSYFERA